MQLVGGLTATTTVIVSHPESVVINGIRWATRNVAAIGTFVDNPEDVGMLYQWNRPTAWPATGTVTGWNSTGATGTTWVRRPNDPCPTGFRVPTEAELNSLRNSPNVWTTKNGVLGRLFGTAPNQIFLPVSRYRNTTGLLNTDLRSAGHYWSSTQSGNTNARYLNFNVNGSSIGNANRAVGFNIRCVAE